MSRSSNGFAAQDHTRDGSEVSRKAFTPEFRNRLDAIVQFKPLPAEVVSSVVDKFLVELQAQLDEKRVQIEVDDEATKWLAKEGFDDRMGARPMARLIQEKIKKPLAEHLLFGALSKGGYVRVTLLNGDLNIDVLEQKTETVTA